MTIPSSREELLKAELSGVLAELRFKRDENYERSQDLKRKAGARDAAATRAEALAELIAYGERAWGFEEWSA